MPITSYTSVCNSTTSSDGKVVVSNGTSAILGDGSVGSSNAPFAVDLDYSCVVIASNEAGTSNSSTPTDTFTGGSLPKTGTFTVPKAVVPNYIIDAHGESGEWFTEVQATGTSQIIASPVSGGPSNSVQLTTACDNAVSDMAGIKVVYSPSIFEGMLLKDFLASFNTMSYKYYKVNNSANCASFSEHASPSMKFEAFSSSAYTAGTTSYTTFVWEPYKTPALNGAPPPTDSWQTETIGKTTGSQTFTSNGGWRSTRSFGQSGLASLQQWETFLKGGSTTSPLFIQDAVVLSISVEIGSNNIGLLSYVNDIHVSSGEYDWTFSFTT